VIPSRNDAAMLKTCLMLLSRQSRPADEIIVVDNSSTDDTADLQGSRRAADTG
jgi:glycosyltransferase involved in cell wall biosynthesis